MISTTKLLMKGLEDKAATRTKKYVCDKRDFEANCADVMFTYETAKSKLRNDAKIEVDGEEYDVTSYEFTKAMVLAAKSARVYLVKDSIGIAEPYHVFTPSPYTCEISKVEETDEVDEDGNPKKKVVKETREPKLLTPKAVKTFWDRYNENQGEKKVELESLTIDDATLMDFSALLAESGKKWVHWNDGAEFNEYVAYVNGVSYPLDTKYVDVYRLPNEEKLSEWLVS